MVRIHMKRPLALLVACALLCCAAAWAEETPAPAESAPAGLPSSEEELTTAPAKGYVLVTTATQSGWLALPEEGEVSFPLRQIKPDSTEALNVIHLTPNSVYMEDANCENHDCIEEGEVTLENRNERVLYNMIVCLPNQVMLALYTPEEVLTLVKRGQVKLK